MNILCNYISDACLVLWSLSGRKLFIEQLIVNKPFCGVNFHLLLCVPGLVLLLLAMCVNQFSG